MKPGKTSKNYWIKAELSRHFADLNFEKGVDLDRNGRIEGSERTDVNDDGEVDVAELKAFLKSNQHALENLGGFLKIFYDHGQIFSPDNPLHNLLFIESEIVSPHWLKTAYQKVERILDTVKRRPLLEYTSLYKLQAVYEVMENMGIRLAAGGGATRLRYLELCCTSSGART